MDKLISIFWSGKASVQQQKELIEKIDRPDAGWEQQLRESYDTSVADGVSQAPEDAYFTGMLDQLHQRISAEQTVLQPPARVLPLRPLLRFSAAAGIVLVLGIGIYRFATRTQPATGTATTPPSAAAVQEVVNANEGNTVKMITMTDGTTIQLHPHSELRYYTSYGDSNRLVMLKSGQAGFKVAHNATKPFVVLAKGIQTRDIGTEFTINTALPNQLVIRLLEGKVVVSATPQSKIALKNLYLKPGQELVLNEATQKITLNNFQTAATDRETATPVPAAPAVIASLDFAQRPLNEVFTTVMHNYHRKIIFNNEDVKELWFTGSFTPDDSIQTVLSAICNMNGLSFTERKGTIIIHKNQ